MRAYLSEPTARKAAANRHGANWRHGAGPDMALGEARRILAETERSETHHDADGTTRVYPVQHIRARDLWHHCGLNAQGVPQGPHAALAEALAAFIAKETL